MSGRRIAYGEARKLAGPFMDEADLVQEGFIGLLRAAKRFDPERGVRYSRGGGDSANACNCVWIAARSLSLALTGVTPVA